MSQHEESGHCRTRNCTRNLCPNQHEAGNDDGIEYVETDSEDKENFQSEENQCHICFKQLLGKDEFLDHVANEHFQGMLDTASNMDLTDFQEKQKDSSGVSSAQGWPDWLKHNV